MRRASIQNRYFVGIAGGSCSGKTTFAHRLAQRLGERDTVCLSIDSYYHGLSASDREQIDRYNFDLPEALDRELLVRHLKFLKSGRPVERPVYDFKTHTRTLTTERIAPLPFVIVEGLFPLYWDDVRALTRTRVFIELPHDVCLRRRLLRDTVERGRPREEVIRRFNEMARPMYDAYVLPSRRFADVVVDGERPIDESLDAVMKDIREKLLRGR